MRFYLDIIKFNFLQELAYPVEILARIIRRLVGIGFLVLFWFAISRTNNNLFNFRQILSYFLIAEGVEDLTFTSAGGWEKDIRKIIRTGLLSNYLIKPINILRFWFTAYVGQRTTITVWGLITLFIGVYICPPQNFIAIPLFLISLLFTIATGAGLNLIVGILTFYSPYSSGGISNVVLHITNILSGHLIPLTYFPNLIKKIAFFSPFPVLTFFPVSILQQGGFDKDTFIKLGLSLCWAVILLTLGNISWRRALKNYDGVGI